MPWPPTTLPPTTVTNATAQLDAHAAYHNQAAQALADAVAFLPRGRMATAQSTLSTGGITTDATVVEIANLAVPAGRRLRVSFSVNVQLSAGGNVFAKITDGANTQLQAVVVTTATGYQGPQVWLEVAPSASPRTMTFRGRVSFVGGTLTLQGGTTQPHTLMVEDIGV